MGKAYGPEKDAEIVSTHYNHNVSGKELSKIHPLHPKEPKVSKLLANFKKLEPEYEETKALNLEMKAGGFTSEDVKASKAVLNLCKERKSWQ